MADDILYTGIPPTPPGLSLLDLNLLRQELQEDTIQAIIRIAEGIVGRSVRNVSVVTAGARGDGVTDDSTAIQNAIDAAELIQGTVFFPVPPATYLTLKPLRMRQYTRLEGPGKEVPTISANFDGPIIVIAPPGRALLPMTTSTLGGLAADFRTTNNLTYLNLRNSAMWDIDGFTGLTIEMSYTPVANNDHIRSLLSSSGSEFSSSSTSRCFLITCSLGNVLGASLKVGGVEKTVMGPVLSAGTRYHVALTYDGANVRLFVNGALVDTEAATGVINQESFERVMLGFYEGSGMMEGQTFFSDPEGKVDYLALAPSALYTAAFTPPAGKVVRDQGRRFVMSFDSNYDTCVGFDSAGAPVTGGYCLTKYLDYGATTGCEIRNMQLSSYGFAIGLIAINSIQTVVEDVSMVAVQCGIHSLNNGFNSRYHGVRIVVTGAPYGSRHFAFGLSNASGGTIRDLQTTGADYPLIVSGSGVKIDDFYGGGNKIPAHFSGQGLSAMGVTLINFNVTNEGYDPDALACFDSVGYVACLGGVFENLNSDTPLVLFDQDVPDRPTRAVFLGTRFQSATGHTSARIKFLQDDPVSGAVVVISRGIWLDDDDVAMSDPPDLVTEIRDGVFP